LHYSRRRIIRPRSAHDHGTQPRRRTDCAHCPRAPGCARRTRTCRLTTCRRASRSPAARSVRRRPSRQPHPGLRANHHHSHPHRRRLPGRPGRGSPGTIRAHPLAKPHDHHGALNARSLTAAALLGIWLFVPVEPVGPGGFGMTGQPTDLRARGTAAWLLPPCRVVLFSGDQLR
jgi:hypothetical protein